MKVWFAEQDVIDAACVYVAEKHRVPIDRLQAELRYDEGSGIGGTVEVQGEPRVFDLSEQDLIDGAALYLSSYHAFDPQRLSVELMFDDSEGVTAVAEQTGFVNGGLADEGNAGRQPLRVLSPHTG